MAHVVLQGRAPGPWLPDEVAYLGGADTLTGGTPALLDGLPYYRWGYSAVLAPLRALPVDDGGRFFAATVVNATLLALVFPLVRRLLRLVGATEREATIGAVLAALQPVVWAYGGFALAEPLVLALVPAWLLAVHRAVATDRPTAGLLLTTLALYATHDRLVVALVPAVWLIVDLGRRSGRVRSIVPAAVGLAVGVAAVNVVDAWMVAVRWKAVATPEAADGGIFGLVTRPSSWDRLAALTVGHGWQLLVSGGVALVVGVVAAVQPPSWRPPAHGEAAAARATRVTGRVAVALLAGLGLASVAFLTVGGTRPDHVVYGRYVEVAIPPLVGWGVVHVLRGGPPIVRLAGLTTVATLATAALLATLPWTEAVRDHRVPVLHAPSLALLTDGTGPLRIGRATAVAVALAVLIGLATILRTLPRATHRRMGTVALVVWLASVGFLDLARSAEVVHDGRRAHVRAEARR